MKYLSVCSGIEAASVAWHTLGWKPAAFSEIEAFPSAVLKHHYPDVPNVGDMTRYKEWNLEPGTIDLLVGGTPCQSFSVAGLRKGLADPRGNLALVYLGIADHFRPRWIVWENVPGVLSSNGGRDFGSFLGALAELGYGFAYRVLDAQFFGVAQRRRRVFVVGYLGDWRPAAAVLFERESLRRDTAPRREKGQRIANCLGASPASGCSPNVGSGQGNVVEVCGTLTARSVTSMGIPEVDGGMYIPESRWPAEVASTLNAAFGSKLGLEDQHINGGAPLFVPAPVVASSGQANANVTTDGTTPTLTCLHEAPIAAYGIPGNWIGRQPENGGNAVEPMNDVAPCLTKTDRHGVAQPIAFTQNQRDEVRELAVAGALAAEPGAKQQTYLAFNARQDPDSWQDRTEPLDTDGSTQAVGVFFAGQGAKAGSIAYNENVAPTLKASDSGTNRTPSAHIGMAVRRLTPVECERLQGFPDNYTNIPWRKQPTAPDGSRYKALGNSMAVPVMAWIGERIQQVDRILDTANDNEQQSGKAVA